MKYNWLVSKSIRIWRISSRCLNIICWKLIQPNNTVVIFFCNENNCLTNLSFEIELKLDGRSIALESCTSDLGLSINHKLKYGDHIMLCPIQDFSRLTWFNRRYIASLYRLKRKYCNLFVLPQFSFADEICLDTNWSRRIQKL